MSDISREGRYTEHEEPFDRNAIAHLLRLAGPRPEVPAEISERVHWATRTEWRGVVSGRRRRRTYLFAGIGLAAAAVLAVALLVPSALTQPGSAPGVRVAELRSATGSVLRSAAGQAAQALPVGGALFSGDRLETGAEARAALGFGADTSLRMDTNTSVRVFDGYRLSLERGSIYIDSGGTGDQVPSVAIVTEYGVVTDVGTQFQVRRSDDRLDVQVREGEVRLSRGDEVHAVGIGVALRLTAGGELTRQAVPLYGPDWDWILDVAQPFELEGETLESFLAWVSRETGWNLAFSSETVAGLLPEVVLHGSITGLRPHQALDAVLPTCGLTHRLSAGTLLIETETR